MNGSWNVASHSDTDYTHKYNSFDTKTYNRGVIRS